MISIDKWRYYLYNKDMTNNNNTNERNEMNTTNEFNFRVYKHTNGTFAAFGNFTSIKAAVDYMRRWNPNQMHNWYIIDENTGRRLQFNQAGTQMIVSCA